MEQEHDVEQRCKSDQFLKQDSEEEIYKGFVFNVRGSPDLDQIYQLK
jgi:hypothetical protein